MLTTIFFVLSSCKQQDIIESIDGNFGTLDIVAQSSPDFGNVLPETSYSKQITLRNIGAGRITSINLSGVNDSLSFAGGSYPGTGGNCNSVILGGSSCVIVLEYNSSEREIFTSELIFSYNDGLESKQQLLTITADAALPGELIYAFGEFSTIAEVKANEASALTFPRVSLGALSLNQITLANTGERTISNVIPPSLINGLSYSGGSYPGINGTCLTSINAGEVCTIEFQLFGFSEGQIVDNYTLSYFDGMNSMDLTLPVILDIADERGNVRVNGILAIEFGKVPQNTPQTKLVQLINDAVLSATDLSMVISNNQGGVSFTGGTYPGINGTCGNDLMALSTCSIELEFNSNILGAHAETLTATFNDNHVVNPHIANKVINITATVSLSADIQLDPSKSIPNVNPNIIGTTTVGVAVNNVLTFENLGELKADQISVTLENSTGGFSIVSGGSCGATKTYLTSGSTCNVRIKAASVVTGSFNANLKISFDNGKGGGVPNTDYMAPLSVTFVDTSNLRLNPSGIDLGQILVNSTSSTTYINLENNGAGDAENIIFDTASISPFEVVSNTCGITLAGNATCTIGIRITPITATDVHKALTINYTDLVGAKTKSLSLNASVRNPALLRLRNSDDTSDIPLVDFKDSPIGQNSTLPLVIRNSGLSATAISASISGTNFSITNSGTCTPYPGFSLTDWDVCEMEITFTPSGPGVINETLTLNYHNGAAVVNTTFTVTGEGAISGLLKVQGVERYQTEVLANSMATIPKSYIFTIENIGSANVTGFTLSPLISYFYEGTNGCLGTIIPGGTCTLEILHNTPIQGTLFTDVEFYYNTSLSSRQFKFIVQVTANTPADISVTFTGLGQPNSYDFGEVPLMITKYLTISLFNSGSISANNFSLSIGQGALTSYSILSTTCPVGGNLSGGGSCQLVIAYSPENKTVHNATLQINYDGYGNEVLPIEVDLSAEGVDPLAVFVGWNQIYAATDASDGEISLKWDPVQPADAGITIDGYNVYMRESIVLPSNISSLAPYLVKTIVGNNPADLNYTLSNTAPDSVYYISVKPTYDGGITIDTTNNTSELKIMMPPPHTALVHPYAVNYEVCHNMGIATDSDHQLGCPFTGPGNVNNYYNFNRYLYVDRYEISLDSYSNPQSVPGATPATYINQLLASSVCTSTDQIFQSETRSKRLMRRSEFVAAAAWGPSLSMAQIETIESGAGLDDCIINQDTPDLTGSASNCVSRYGIYDLVGNIWEWNSDQINNAIGWNSSVDITNTETFGLNMGGLFPNLVTDLPCFNFALGVVLNYDASVCTGSTLINSNENIFLNDYYWPAIMTGIKPVRSGGSVGVNGGFSTRKGGRWVGDYNTQMTTAASNTGARCVFTLPFE